MMSTVELRDGWHVLQDVHNAGERLGLHRDAVELDSLGAELSEWTPIDRLRHLQLIFAATPYGGRELRSFNSSPWWYRNEFEVDPAQLDELTLLRFTNADFFATVWLNGQELGRHEGYALPFEFDVSGTIRAGRNVVHVRVTSPWDEEVAAGSDHRRFAQVVRGMAKGTYEHDDGFIQRDVNPIGLYGAVTVEFHRELRVRQPTVTYALSVAERRAFVRVAGTVDSAGPIPDRATVAIDDPEGVRVIQAEVSIDIMGEYDSTVELTGVRLWETWDRGEQPLYTVTVAAGAEHASVRTGFRSIEMIRTTQRTALVLNEATLFVRGSNYFSDAYLSRVDEARYRRDLEAAKRAGINLLRIHVHVENLVFYDLCDELGIGVMQESDFNWMHPTSTEWNDRFVRTFADTVEQLLPAPCVLLWSCMNEPASEPGAMDLELHKHFTTVSPGPQLVEVLQRKDPSRPAILASGDSRDLRSGDSHTFLGSLHGENTHYTDIDAVSELFNSEFGMDAPPTAEKLRTTGPLGERLRTLDPLIPEIQRYQYRLLKYYIDHYRVQKFRPCSGYMQFTLTDLAPNAFYGILDWWGDTKPGFEALLESNQPVAVVLEQTATTTEAVWVLNDTLHDLDGVTVAWTVVDRATGLVLVDDERTLTVPANEGVRVAPLHLNKVVGGMDVHLRADDQSGAVATNRYIDVFDHPAHPAGHPLRISHELGVRLFSA
ncbi:beta-galactosidase [Microbacteriaceae bacterium VKM Ac-2855]|nr:beta-galactosidase [Microbacteriaceae bacterium VKM Ac-2855]